MHCPLYIHLFIHLFRSKPITVAEVTSTVRERIGQEDVFLLGDHIRDTQYGIDNHHHQLLTIVVSLFFKLRLHHIAKLFTLDLQHGSKRQKVNKVTHFKGH